MGLVLFLGLANKTNTEFPKCSQKGRECGKRRRKMGVGMISAELSACRITGIFKVSGKQRRHDFTEAEGM